MANVNRGGGYINELSRAKAKLFEISHRVERKGQRL